MKFTKYILIFVLVSLFSCRQENKASGSFKSVVLPINNPNILDTFPLPADKYENFKPQKTANEYFESAYNRMLDGRCDSIVIYINIREYQSAIKLDSTYWYAYRNLASCFSRIKRDDLAYKSIKQAFKYCTDKENEPELFAIRGKILFRQNRFIEAIPDFQKLVDIGYSPLADSYYWLAYTTLKSGQKEKAIKIIKNAKDIDFSDYELKEFGL
jgi:tetratricopeptide (TPR) repeat protein